MSKTTPKPNPGTAETQEESIAERARKLARICKKAMDWVGRHARGSLDILDNPGGSMTIEESDYATVRRVLFPMLELANTLAIGLGLATREDPVFRDAQYDPAPGENIVRGR